MYERFRQVDRRLAAKLGEHRRRVAVGPGFVFEHVAHGFLVQRFEVQSARCVEVGADRLRIRIDHHALHTVRAQRHRRSDRAVIELDTLTDADRSGAEHDDLLAWQRVGFVLGLECAVEVRRNGLELGGAGIDHLVGRADVPCEAPLADALGHLVEQRADLAVGKAEPFGASRERGGELLRLQQLTLALDQVQQLVQEEAVSQVLVAALRLLCVEAREQPLAFPLGG